MARSNEVSNHGIPQPPDEQGWRHFGDGFAGRLTAARIQGYYASGADYRDVAVDASGNLLAALTASAIEIGTVDQGAAGGTAWPVSVASLPLPALAATSTLQGTGNTSLSSIDGKLPALVSSRVPVDASGVTLTVGSHAVTNAGTFAVQAAATLAAETTKVIGVTRTSDGSGNLVTSTGNALDINIKSGNPTSITANAGTNLNTSLLALDSTLTGGTQISRAYGIYNAAQPSPADTNQLQLQVGSRGSLRAELFNAGGTVGVAAGVTNTDGQGNSNGLIVHGRNALWNPATPGWDLERNNFNTTTGDTGAKATAAFLGAAQTNYNARGAIITCLVGTVTGAVTTWQTGIQFSYDGGTTWLELTPLGANDTAVSTGKTYTWIIYPTNTSQAAGTTPATLVPGTISVAGPTQLNIVNAALPRTWRFAAQVSVVTSIVITSVNVNYIL